MKNDTMETTKNTEAAQTGGKPAALWLKIVLGLVLVLVIGFFGFTSVVREGNCAVILRFGAPRAEITEAGLYFKLPWPFETVTMYDSRLQYLESNALETTTKDNRNLILQSYALWSIKDPLRFHNSIGSQAKVENYIKDQIFNATNSVLGSYELTALVSLDDEAIRSDEIQAKIFSMVKENCEKNYGVTISDVSILRIFLPDTNLESVFEQMRADRQKDIDTILAEAQRDANIIISNTDASYYEILAKAEIEAADIYAQTEAEVAKIYAEAQNANLELYQFLKELNTIVSSVKEDTILVVTADTYPFNVLLEYSNTLTNEGNETVIHDLEYILGKLPKKDREALVDAIYELIEEAGNGGVS